MNYKLITDVNELKGNWFFEFLPGKYQYTIRNKHSVFLYEDSLAYIEHLLINIKPNYDHYGITELSISQIKLFIEECENVIKNIEVNKHSVTSHFYPDEERIPLNGDLIIYKSEIIALIKNLISWMREIIKTNEVISILGL